MSVELTPSGSRGGKMPKIPKAVQKVVLPIANLFLKSKGMRLLQLTTVGARSDNEHTVYLTHFPDGDGFLVVGSAGGAAKHPAWLYNLARNPDKVWITVDGRKMPARAESLTGDVREAAWRRITSEQSIYAGYEQKTDREIPVVRLTPA
jgi:deazaflavin-dependent oxidoreductase (nitroreductase family)